MKRYTIYHKPKSKLYLVMDNLTQHRSILLTAKELISANVRTCTPVSISSYWIVCAEIDDLSELPQLPQTHPELFI